MNDKLTFKSKDKNGKEIEYRIILSFYFQETKKDYIVYTDDTCDESGRLNVYAAIFYPSEPNRNLEAVKTDSEWNEIEKLLKKLDN